MAAGHPVPFAALITGVAYLSSLFDNPILPVRLLVNSKVLDCGSGITIPLRGFHFCGATNGKARIH